MASPAQDIAGLLQTKGLGVLGTSLFYSREPAKSGVLVTVYDIGGNAPEAKWLRDYAAFQIRVKGKPDDYASAWDKAQAIKDALHSHPPVTLSGRNFIGIWLTTDLLHLGTDEADRAIIISQYRTVLEGTQATAMREVL